MLVAIADAASQVAPYDSVDAAVAYASVKGVEHLNKQLEGDGCWGVATKRFLISIDFGVTEPLALARLAQLPNASVRVPNGQSVVEAAGLRPSTVFHAKTFMFRASGSDTPISIIVGSANLTLSALQTGSEVVTRHSWADRASPDDLQLLANYSGLLDWFEDAWSQADPLEVVLDSYRALTGELEVHRDIAGEGTKSVSVYEGGGEASEPSGELAVQMLEAKALWFETSRLYRNLTRDRGNQLDMPRGARIFFGFEGDRVPPMTKFGTVEIHIPGFAAVRRTVNFAHNSMDKITLPVPGVDGPETYDHQYLIFEKLDDAGGDGLRRYRLDVTNLDGLERRKASAASAVDRTMSSGRQYGLLF